ncbi:MAG: hypothetical protein ACLVCS_10435 [Christensenellaceae bacterium]
MSENKRRKRVCFALILTMTVFLAACGNGNLRMSAGEVAENVVYNESMVGVSGTLNKYFGKKIMFNNDDPNRDKYMTNNVHSGITPELDIDFVEGAYYEAFVDINGIDYARATVAAVQFETPEAAQAAYPIIENNLNLSPNEDGTCDLEYGKVSIRGNIIFVVATYENNTQLELTRVFNNKNYVK